jgi:hypothetical protein
MHTLKSFTAALAGVLVVTTGYAQEQVSPKEAAEPAELASQARTADKTGTDPSNFQQTFSLANEYVDLAHNGAYLNTATLTYAEPLSGGRARLSVELPFAATDSTGRRESGLADSTVRYNRILHLDRRKAFAAGLGLVAPTATEDPLGTGKWSLEPGASAIFFLSREWIVAPSFKQTISIAGDSARADVNLSAFDFYVVWRSPSLKEWVIVDPAFAWNWKKDRDQLIGSTTLTYGRLLGRTGEAVWSGYVKPGAGWGSGRASDWSIEAGLKVVGF